MSGSTPKRKLRSQGKKAEQAAEPAPAPPAGDEEPTITVAEAAAAGKKAAARRDVLKAPFVPLDTEAPLPAKPKKKGKGGGAGAVVAAGAGGVEVARKPNVVYLGSIPHGFYEEQMSAYFGQFGTVTRMRLSRNKKTGASKHYAFLEFETPEVAAIVAECMDNYLMFGRLLKVKLIPPEAVHPRLWLGANRKFRQVAWAEIAREKRNKERTPAEHKKMVEKLLRAERQRNRKLKDAGIDYEFGGLAALVPKKRKHMRFEGETGEAKTAKKAKAGV